MQHPMTRTGRTAPHQDAVIASIRKLMVTEPEPEVPADGYDRVDYRLEIVLDGLYDGAERAAQRGSEAPVRDLLTDLVHLCEARGWSIESLLERAHDMALTERKEWGER